MYFYLGSRYVGGKVDRLSRRKKMAKRTSLWVP